VRRGDGFLFGIIQKVVDTDFLALSYFSIIKVMILFSIPVTAINLKLL